MTSVKHPLIDLVMNDETSRYVGHLERKILHFTLDDMKMRSLIELLTGQQWDTTDFRDMSDAEIQKVAIDTLKRRLQMSDQDARKLVAQRWQAANPPADVEQLKATYLMGPKPKTPAHVVTISRPIVTNDQPLNYDYRKHLEGLATVQRHREQRRSNPSGPDPAVTQS